jgi:Flp pilus assembly protein TadG
MMRFAKLVRRAWREEDGVASIEFVFAVPILMAIFMASFESGLFMTREIMLEQSVDIVMRELRLGHYPAPVTTDKLKTEICNRTVVFNNCAANIMIELQKISTTTFAMPTIAAECRDLSQPIKPSTTLQIGVDNDLMLVRACIIVDALFPTTGIGLNLTRTSNGGGVQVVTVSAFANEPS